MVNGSYKAFLCKNITLMKPIASKIAFLFALYAGLHLLEACYKGCDCPDVDQPFFDYHGIVVNALDSTIADLNGPYRFTIRLTKENGEILTSESGPVVFQ